MRGLRGWLAPGERRLRRRVRADFEARVRRARLRAAGWSEDEYRTALRYAARAWSARTPWRLIPIRTRLALYPFLGRAFTARHLARWRQNARTTGEE